MVIKLGVCRCACSDCMWGVCRTQRLKYSIFLITFHLIYWGRVFHLKSKSSDTTELVYLASLLWRFPSSPEITSNLQTGNLQNLPGHIQWLPSKSEWSWKSQLEKHSGRNDKAKNLDETSLWRISRSSCISQEEYYKSQKCRF